MTEYTMSQYASKDDLIAALRAHIAEAESLAEHWQAKAAEQDKLLAQALEALKKIKRWLGPVGVEMVNETPESILDPAITAIEQHKPK